MSAFVTQILSVTVAAVARYLYISNFTVSTSESVSAALVFLFYHLAARPDHAKKLRAELAGMDSTMDVKALEVLPHLNGIIFETL